MSDPAIKIDHFSHRYGRTDAVHGLDLEVARGSILGLVGQNGAGKTTTIRALLNLIQPTKGSLSVLGLDSMANARQVRERVGHVAESPNFYDWMTVREILSFNAAFYTRWDDYLAGELVERLGLDPGRRLGILSRGTQAKVGLVMALAHRPDVLLLDDPTSGLDPIVRREFIEEIIRTVQGEGGTVFFSSHLLHEMERVADEVAILHEGHLVLHSPLEQLKTRFKQMRATYTDAPPTDLAVAGLVRQEVHGRQLVLTVRDFSEAITAEVRRSGAIAVEILDLPLEEIFVETLKAITSRTPAVGATVGMPPSEQEAPHA